MKKLSLVLILGAALAAMVVAEGVQESEDWTPGSGLARESEEIQLDGTYSELEGHPAMEANGNVYSLSAPGYRRYAIDLAEGDPLTVEGFLWDCPADCEVGADGHIQVTEATVNGETYELAEIGGFRGQMGRGFMHDGPMGRGRSGRRPMGPETRRNGRSGSYGRPQEGRGPGSWR